MPPAAVPIFVWHVYMPPGVNGLISNTSWKTALHTSTYANNTTYTLRDLWESPVPAMAYLRASGLLGQTV